MARIVMSVILAVLLPLAAMAQTQTHAQVQEKPPYPAFYSGLTNDFADILTDEAEARINAELLAAREQRQLEMAVVTIRSRSDYAPSTGIEQFSTRLFNGWGIGRPEINDGILLLVAIEDREVRIALGAGYPAREDGIAARIIQTEILPAFRDGRVADGIFNGTRAALAQLRVDRAPPPAPQPAPPPASVATPAATEQPPEPQSVGLITRITQSIGRMSDSAVDNPLLAIIIAAAGGIAAYFGQRLWPQWRPRKCPECRRIMLRLGEAQEDQYLDYGQLVEERIKSKDYGVWFCPHDEHLTVKGFRKMFSRHKACPECGYHTYETQRTVLSAASTVSMGVAQLDHSCRNCNHTATQKVSIPKIQRSSSSGSGGRSSGFSSSSSGGFSGGRSSGGGASGSW